MINTFMIGEVVNNKLSNLVNNKCYPLIAENSTTFPFIVYSRDSITPMYCKDGNYEDTVNITVKVVSETYSDSIRIANSVRERLTLHNFTNNGMNIDSSLSSANESYESESYVQTLVFEMKINNI